MPDIEISGVLSESFKSLCDYIEKNITDKDGYSPSFRLTIKFLTDNSLNVDSVLEWLCEKKCFSDYEVLHVLKQRLLDTSITDNENACW
jgi:hypothetical protein